MQRFKFGLVAALFLLVCLLVLAPARLVTVFIPAGQAQLQGVNGSLWHGTASRAVVSTQVGALQLGQLEWRIKPWSLLLLAPRVELRSQWGQQYLNAQLLVRGAEDIDLNAVDVRLPAELVKQVLPLELAGLVSLQASRLSVRAGVPVAAEGRLVWQQAGWRASGAIRPLGDYALELTSSENGNIAGEVITLSGDLVAEGGLALEGNQYSVDVLLSGPGLDDRMLQQSLQLVATPEGQNFRVKLTGAL
ncbi:hypothetical protein GCM10007052_08200 [Halioglobus japonicus]|uniref:Type II secretion system protein N n=1 Tax=Halioglobus japonicus TaxID=930805 RepID=A0AAP8MG11_9GAMM|nr:type II secretion system protein N [Halioglobus japonicus]PLW87191.1 general secretion pathway protein GspN [Halioglobus japonicus]GHD09740.1 hypothetical protein GCM10007052_08200 [Halioglobus japonicus]